MLLYSASIGALTSENYATLAAIFTKQVIARTRRSRFGRTNLIVPAVDGVRDVLETNIWGSVEGYNNKRTPDSEYMFAILKEPLDGLLFLGARYDQLFDSYEILRTLVYADVTDNSQGPLGRFAWKYYSRNWEESPYHEVCAEAALQGDQWGPIKAGLFRGSYKRFEQVAKKFEAEFLSKLGYG